MKTQYKLGKGIIQVVPFNRYPVQQPIKDHDLISWKFIKIFAICATIKVIVFLFLL